MYYKEKELIVEKGILDYPKLRKRKEIYLDKDDELAMEKILKDIEKIMCLEIPPNENKKAYCKKCSYYELCFI